MFKHDDGARVGLFDGLDEIVLAGGQVHGLEVEAFGFDLVVPADDDHGDIGVPGRIHRFFEGFGAGFGSVLGGIFSFHADAQRVLYLMRCRLWP